MHRVLSALTALVFLFPSSRLVAAPGIAPTEALSPDQQRTKFRLPPGFEIQLVVAEPDIGQPMNLNFDARGRLWVTHSVEYPFPAQGDVEPRTRFAGMGDHPPRDRLTIVEGIAENGRAKKITHFATGLNIPIGHVPLGDGSESLVYSIPNIYRAVDRNQDGEADAREVLYGRFGNIDTHGMVNSLTRWIDGWVYGCHGFANTSKVRDASGNLVEMNSGNTYRFREDGTRFEQYTWGQVNPFGMTFDPWGNLYDSDCHSMPVYQLLRGAYYPSFGKPHDGLGFGPKMIDHGHGSTGICGPAFYSATHFPPAFRDSIFICNPVNCVVHHDRLKEVGSTRLADTQPEFVTCDDGWFRPVDLAVGPDGALYIADFYNCIIGHYEVPLDHPRRDRTHGRIWRVVYTGEKDQTPPPQPMPDLTKLPLADVVEKLNDPNLVVRTLATNWLVDTTCGRFAPRRGIDSRTLATNWLVDTTRVANAKNGARDVVAAIRQAIARKGASAESLAHGLWVLERIEGLSGTEIDQFAQHPSPLVRTHLVRALAERDKWTAAELELVREKLFDEHAMVRRVSADALGRHPHVDNVAVLMRLLETAPHEDTHLVHTIRIALRDQMRDKDVLVKLRELEMAAQHFRLLVMHTFSIETAAAAEFALEYLSRFAGQEPRAAELVEYASRFLPPDRVPQLSRVIRTHFDGDLKYQIDKLLALQTGLEKRGDPRNPEIVAWARELVAKVLQRDDEPVVSWTALATADGGTTEATTTESGASTWSQQQRVSADGDRSASFWSSLPHGERRTGILRSGTFRIPKQFSFFIAGHNGPTNQPEVPRNFVRLRDAQTREVLAETKPPRNDVAQPVQWDLSEFAGRSAYLELIDGFDATGYAWLAVGRFSLPALNHDHANLWIGALQLIERFELAEFQSQLAKVVRDSSEAFQQRVAAANALSALRGGARMTALLSCIDAEIPRPLAEEILQCCADADESVAATLLEAVMARAPRDLQRKIAESLASEAAGAAALLHMIEIGKASPRLLRDGNLRNRLAALKIDRQRIDDLTKGLPATDAALVELINRHVQAFDPAAADIAAGREVFQKNCAACHQLGGEGKKVGPQLDGIGGRGLARIVEDILDPNRNVDPAFRTLTLLTTDGKVVSGLVRRTEGETIVMADNQGKEFRIATASIDERTQTSLSLMPANFHETLPSEAFANLLAFLLTQQPEESNRPAVGP